MAKLSSLIPGAPSVEFTGIEHDSRKVQKGDVFFAIKGATGDGHDYAYQAIANGAAAIICERKIDSNIPQLISKNTRHDLAIAAAKFHPHKLKNIAAVTGTNGKTSVAEFTRQLWEMQGEKASSIGTLGFVSQGKTAKTQGDNTSPEALTLHRTIHNLEGNLVIEASSIGIEQQRLDGLNINRAAFTNFTQDHLDYHGGMQEYFRCKALLFSELMEDGVAVLNKDMDEFSALEKTCNERGHKVITFGKNADLQVLGRTPNISGQEIELSIFGKESTHHINLIGAFQLDNILTSLALTDAFEAGLSHLQPVEGRMQTAASGVYVDYAHTPDALQNALQSLRPHCEGELHVVFGCGGDRDKTKRPQMGAIAAKFADKLYVTDDNPRTENASQIRKEILAKCTDAQEIPDRHNAIETALKAKKTQDIVLIAGKGHEKYQIIGDQKHYFDDIAVVKELL